MTYEPNYAAIRVALEASGLSYTLDPETNAATILDGAGAVVSTGANLVEACEALKPTPYYLPVFEALAFSSEPLYV